MITFAIGILILFAGYALYGRLAERLFRPDDRRTPATASPDGVDRVPLPFWKNLMIHLLNIAGVGPVIGVILGIKFGAIVFIILPVGNVIGGAVHDYFSGMISMRHNGANMPTLARLHLGRGVYPVYAWFLFLALLLIGAVFINIPAQILSAGCGPGVFWGVAGAVFLYYFIAAFFPVDAVIGRIYPYFGGLLALTSLAVLAALAPHLGLLSELDLAAPAANFVMHPDGEPIVPMLFVTIACGIISGFHSTQAPIVARTATSERHGRPLFYGMMIAEGVIGMIWAAGGMALYARSPELLASGAGAALLRALTVWLLGPVGAWVALSGVIVLAITSGDTALRSLRLAVAEYAGIDQKPVGRRVATTVPIFLAVAGLLAWSNADPGGFKTLWNYFAWANQVLAVFALMIAAIWLPRAGRPPWIALLPGAFMLFIVSAYILWVSPSNLKGAPVGLGLPYGTALAAAGAVTLAVSIWVWRRGGRRESPVNP